MVLSKRFVTVANHVTTVDSRKRDDPDFRVSTMPGSAPAVVPARAIAIPASAMPAEAVPIGAPVEGIAIPLEAVPVSEVIMGTALPNTAVPNTAMPNTSGAAPALAPEGQWAQELCDCSNQCCSRVWWSALFCGPTVAAQLYEAEVQTLRGTCNQYAVLLWGCFILACVVGIAAVTSGDDPNATEYNHRDEHRRGGRGARFLSVLALVAGTVMVVRVLSQVRWSIRQRSNIRARYCSERHEDCWLTCLCQCCVSMQMLRHLRQAGGKYKLCHPTAGIQRNYRPNVGRITV